MRGPRILFLAVILALSFGTLACRAQDASEAQESRKVQTKDPLAAEIARLLETPGARQIRPVLERAQEDLSEGRRVLALQRVVNARATLAASERTFPKGQALGVFESEWQRTGTELAADLRTPSPAALNGLEPAALRALAEAALPQVRIYYHASLDYGRNTTPDSGFHYLSEARMQREVVNASRALSTPSGRKVPPVRSLEPELDALQHDLLTAYRPPAWIERHREFIAASSTLKEARELDQAGLHHGALLRYLQAAQRVAPLRHGSEQPARLTGEALAARLRELDGRLFLETAQAEPGEASVIAQDVLPRYFAALEPAPPRSPRPAPEVTVTLVRWPYT
jgi:hypothetical protein